MRQRFEINLDHHTSGVPLTGKVVVVEWKDVNDPLPKTYTLFFQVDEGMFSLGSKEEPGFPIFSEKFYQHLKDSICSMYNTVNHKPHFYIWNITEE